MLFAPEDPGDFRGALDAAGRIGADYRASFYEGWGRNMLLPGRWRGPRIALTG